RPAERSLLSRVQGGPGLRRGRRDTHLQRLSFAIPSPRRHSQHDRRGGREVLIPARRFATMPSLRPLWTAALAMCLAPVIAHGAPTDVRLVASGPSLIHFVVEVPPVAMRGATEITDSPGAV